MLEFRSSLPIQESFETLSQYSGQIQNILFISYGFVEENQSHAFALNCKCLSQFHVVSQQNSSESAFSKQGLETFVATVFASRAISFIHLYALISNLPLISKVRQLSRKGEPLTALEITIHLEETKLQSLSEYLFKFSRDSLIDVALQKDDIYRTMKRLIIFDMDSTLIKQEVIDELAREAGVYDQIAPITESAMRGEIDFNESLARRVALLKDQPIDIIETIKGRVVFTDGAIDLCRILKHLGFKMAVLSGGFMPLANYVKNTLKLDYAFANNLQISEDGKSLTGKVYGSIVNAERKAELVSVISQAEHVAKPQIFAVGDGANDLLMLARAGAGIAFNAKPLVQQRAAIRINQPSLLNILFLLGLDDEQIAELNKHSTNITEAYEDVRNDKTETDWLIVGYKDDKGEVLGVEATGSGSLPAFKKALKPDQAYFGYIRMVVGNDELSRRAKFLFVSWCGPNVKVMRRGKLSVHIADVKSVLKSFAVEIPAETLEDLEEKKVTLLLQKAMGANYDRQASAY